MPGTTQGVSQPALSPSSVRAYYDRKTADILERYGPGPRVHYHVAPVSGTPSPLASADEIRSTIVEAQTKYLDRCAQVWDAPTVFKGRILDIGCGLGGPSIYWAQRFSVEVTAVTIAAEHARLAAEFATQAGVGHLVRPMAADFTTMEVADTFDAAVSTGATCHMDRHAVFLRAAQALPVGGYFCIEDLFLGKPEGKKPADTYWTIDIGTVSDYERVAQACGFVMDRNEDVTAPIASFWAWSMSWAEARLAQLTCEGQLREEVELRLLRSIREHARKFRCYQDRVYEERIMLFRKVR